MVRQEYLLVVYKTQDLHCIQSHCLKKKRKLIKLPRDGKQERKHGDG